jgi:hypothetical protein
MNIQHLPRHYYPGHVFIPKEGYYQVRRIGLTAQRVQTDPRFFPTRKQANRFTQLVRCATLIRRALCMYANIKGDAPHLLQRLKEIELEGASLQGFNLNRKAHLEEVCKIEAEVAIDEDTGQTIVTLPSFVPAYYLLPPEANTHARLYMITTCINIRNNTYTCFIDHTSLLPLKKIHIPSRKFVSVKGEEETVTIVAMGINWYAQQAATGKILPSKTPGSLQIISAGQRLADS